MPKHQFPGKTLLVGFAPLSPSGLLIIMATIPDGAPSSSPAYAKRNSRGTDPFQSVQGTDFMDFALQSKRYERW
ncbi:hypothetical protein SAMN05216315_109102 [Nitrosospira sp. Nsp18]|uniref:hypothetical protein n=1 Tax=Nitrosospira sp. Nsp18 TaxID=1855334 RepID=UPI00087F361B|nr:hypothetical protein [Nitrosospira sp. Nsp18]SDA17913.1 hypothetical protein SAMN05216315_109102 [Nitrosospira sp. Nsp18]